MRRSGENSRPQLLDLIPKDGEWKVRGGEEKGCRAVDEEQQLELRLWPIHDDGKEHIPPIPSIVLSFPKPSPRGTSTPCAGAKRGFMERGNLDDAHNGFGRQQRLQCYMVDGMMEGQQRTSPHKKTCLLATAPAIAAPAENASVDHKKSHSRIAPLPVVGWPPVRSFRKNITNSSKPSLVSQDHVLPKKLEKLEGPSKGLFLKINMDGIPIGRKIDLKAYKSYESLSIAAVELFRGLLAAQRGSDVDSGSGTAERSPTITGILDGSGEYTLVYEDSDGDWILVGDIPWDMFVSSAKRLRILKTSQLPSLALGVVNKKKDAPES